MEVVTIVPKADQGGSAVFEKYCTILDALSRSREPLRLSDLAHETGLAKSTVHRLMSVLCTQDLAVFDEHIKSYSLGYRVLRWASCSWANSDLVQAARAPMDLLHERTGEHVTLAVRDGTDVVFLAGTANTQYRRGSLAPAQTGQRAPIHCTATGKVLAAFLSPDVLSVLVERMEFTRFTDHTITVAADFLKELDTVRAEGVATNKREEFEIENSIGAPVRDHQGHVVAAVSVFCLESSVDMSTLLSWKQHVLTAADAISARIGHSEH